MHPLSCTHHDVTDLVNHGIVKNAKTWISWERNITFLRNEKILKLCLIWHILKSYCFVGEWTFTKAYWRNKLYTCKFWPPLIHFKTTSDVNFIIMFIIQRNFWRNCAILWTVPLKLRTQGKTELSWSNISKFNYKKKRTEKHFMV